MTEELHQLAFRSEAPDTRESLVGLLEILAGAHRRNGEAGLTGAVALSGSRYFQVLEGDAQAIDATQSRIETDPRHKTVQVVARRPVAFRSFDSWSLASPKILPGLRLQIDLAISACEADCDYAISLLRSVVMTQQRNGRLLAA